MANIRVFLWVGLGLLIWMGVQTWQADYAPRQAAGPATPQTIESPTGQGSSSQSTDFGELPALPDVPDLPGTTGTREAASATAAVPLAASSLITVRTDVLELQIDPNGGDIRSARLLGYPLHKDQPDVPVRLLNPDAADLFVYRTGLRALDGAVEANHLSRFIAEQSNYALASDADELSVRLAWSGQGGISVEKIYQVKRGSYAIGLEQKVTNGSQAPYRAVSYLQIQRRHNPPERSMFNVDSYSFMGPVIFDGAKYEKLDVDDLADEPFEQTVTGGWIASIQHHFLVAAIPPLDTTANYQVAFNGSEYNLSAIQAAATTIAPDESAIFPSALFVGPKLQTQLEATADGLALTVDYGVFTVLSQPLFWLLQKIYQYIGNWGWTIIIVTILIKLAFYKLTETSGRSMAKMRKLQPRLKALQDRHKDDREALSKAMMELYKREKVNPAAGCFPMLIQIPFFMAFYWVLLESVEMRQAPFVLWITDLSSRDPWFILPLLMGAAMYFQQKLNPAPPDPMQAKIMQFLPVMFTAMFAFFPAGLVLYWLTNSVLSMAQQWRINKVLGAA
jgi:YidC/Oxa1 family membrane protein insertase